MEKKTCFAWMPDECYALKVKDCDGCNFYKLATDKINIAAIEADISQRKREARLLAKAEARRMSGKVERSS